MKTSQHKILSEHLAYMKKVRLFSDLNEEQIKKMISIMKIKEADAESYIIREGGAGNYLYILLKGEVEISKELVLPQWIQSAQKQEKSLSRLSEKQHPFFGEMAMFDEEPERSASIKAIRPCLLAEISKENLLQICKNNPGIGMIIFRNIASELGNRLRKVNRDLLKLTTAFMLALEG